VQVPDAGASLNLRANDGNEVALALGDGDTGPCTDSCYAALPAGILEPTTSYVVEIGADVLHFEGGKPVPAGQVGSFTTADAPDEYAPLIVGFAMTLVEGCVQAELRQTSRRGARSSITAGDQVASLDLGAMGTKFDLLTHLPDLPADVDAQAVARATDRAGNSADSAAVALHLPPKLPRLVITEVLANPAGSEYTQEFVELENLEGRAGVAGRHAHRRQDRQRRLARCGCPSGRFRADSGGELRCGRRQGSGTAPMAR